MRERPANGAWEAERGLTRAESIDRHPLRLLGRDALWMLYENAQTEAYFMGKTDTRRIIMARVTPSPENYRQTWLLYGRCEAPAAAFDSAGRIWIAYLKPRLPRGWWDVYFTGFDGEKWEEPRAVSSF